MTLADRIAFVLEDGPMAECHIATAVRKRKEDVSAALDGNPGRFVHNGKKARASRWGLVGPVPSFDATSLLALHPNWTQEWAENVIGWLLDAGLAASVSANRRVYVSDVGYALSRALSLCEVTG